MSMSRYMHPRNIYKEPPNFKQLALDYPEFRKYAIQSLTGKVTIDFKNLEALRALTCTLLKKDFNLDLEIPLNKLIPTIPLRLNYILWIEDLLSISGKLETIRGIDVGTGASCIYPLLGASKNKWMMTAFEIDPESVSYAKNNIQRNSLGHLITVIENTEDSLVADILNLDSNYDFLMCNPPFFGSPAELHPFFKARKQNRPHPRNAFCASTHEVVANGGEIEYISTLIKDSKTLKNKIRIFTTMVGHKSSLPQLKKLLREANVISFKQTEFCQGHTTRWGLAWTFLDINLKAIPDSVLAIKKHAAKPLVYQIPKDKNFDNLVDVSEELVKIFNNLELDICVDKQLKNFVGYTITAYSNTWSHQRRKKREKLKLSQSEDDESAANKNLNDIKEACHTLAAMDFNETKKRHLEEDGFYSGKKFRNSYSDCVMKTVYLKCKVNILKDDDCVGLELNFIDGNKEGMHQILQYLKNNLEK